MASDSLRDRFWAKVEKTDTCWNWTAAKLDTGYGKYAIGKRAIRAHRFSFEMANGPIAPGLVVDHTCHNKTCVNPHHLRAITQKRNSENRGRLNRDNTSGYAGVTRHNRGWMGRVGHNGRKHYAGTFDTPEEAAEAVRQLRLSLFTHNDLDRKES